MQTHQNQVIPSRERHLDLPLIDDVAWLQALDKLGEGSSLEFEGFLRHPDASLEYTHERFSELRGNALFSSSVVSRAFSAAGTQLRSPAEKAGFQIRLHYIVPNDTWFHPWLQILVLEPDFSRVRPLHDFAVTLCIPDLDERAVARSIRDKAKTLGLRLGEIRSGSVGEGSIVQDVQGI